MPSYIIYVQTEPMNVMTNNVKHVAILAKKFPHAMVYYKLFMQLYMYLV